MKKQDRPFGLYRQFILLSVALYLAACSGVTVADDEVPFAETEEQEVDIDSLPFFATGPVARVNGEDISAAAFNAMVKERTERIPNQIPPQMLEMFMTQTLDFLVSKHLVDGVLEGEDIEVTEEDLDEAFAEFRERFQDDEAFQDYLVELGKTEEQMRELMQEDVELEKFLSTRYDLEISEEDARAFYEDNHLQFYHGEEVHARHILLVVEGDADEAGEAAVKERADIIYALAIEEGADFEELARENSEGPTGPEGGDLGFFSRERMVPDFAEAAFAMEAGDISEPIRTQFGYHIIQVVERRDAATTGFEEVRDQIEVQLRHQKRAQAFQTFLEAMKADAEVELFTENIEVNAAMTQ